MRRSIRLLLSMLLLLAIAGCSSEPQSPDLSLSEPKPPVLLNVRIASDLKAPDPALASDPATSQAVLNLFEGLVRLTEKGVSPGLAATWAITANETTYTFHLRDGLTWSNGESLTAEDLWFAWIRLLDPATKSPNASILDGVKGAREFRSGQSPLTGVGFSAPDAKTFVVTLTAPDPTFLAKTASPSLMPVPKRIAAAKRDWASAGGELVVNGPFKLSFWEEGGMKSILVKNPAYWNAQAVKTDEISLFLYTDAQHAMEDFHQGSLDLVPLPSAQILPMIDPALLKSTAGQGYYLQSSALTGLYLTPSGAFDFSVAVKAPE